MTALPTSKRRNMALLVGAIVLTLSVWFAGTAAVPALLAEGLISPSRAAWLTACVQLGFVFGTLLSAVFSLADRWPARWLFLGCAALAAAATPSAIAVSASAVGGSFPPKATNVEAAPRSATVARSTSRSAITVPTALPNDVAPLCFSSQPR